MCSVAFYVVLLCLQCHQSGCYSLVNVAADSGNTPLHAAVNRGDVAVVQELLSSPNIHVDAVNQECGDVTPLLLAAMHGLLHDITIPPQSNLGTAASPLLVAENALVCCVC